MQRRPQSCAELVYINAEFMNEKKFDWNRLIQAFTDENAAFNFPIKYPAVDLDKSTKDTLLMTAGILAAGMVITGFLLSGKKLR